MNPFSLFTDTYGRCTPTLRQLRTLVDAAAWTQEELEEERCSSNDSRVRLWYQVAVLHEMTRTGTLRKRCEAENKLRSAWSRFLVLHVQNMPEVPPLPT